MRSTIFALATAPGRSAVAVIRVSGPGAGAALSRLIGRDLPSPRLATLATLRDPATGERIDQALVLWFPGPSSFTGEDQCELHAHGGLGVVQAILSALLAIGLQPAEPGAFTRRAFENGKLDLTQAEAVADLVDAETAAQRRQALSRLGGAASARLAAWRGDLLEAAALLEADLDFPDEDLPDALDVRAHATLRRLRAALANAVEDGRGERIREGLSIVLLGPVNAGKSSLFNCLVGRDAAIVTEHAGTTRDVIEAPLEIAGYKAVMADTAGLRSTADPIEAEGVRRARALAERADIRLWVVDGSADTFRPQCVAGRENDLVVITKSDLGQGVASAEARSWAEASRLDVVQCHTGEVGTEPLIKMLGARVLEMMRGAETPIPTRWRHKVCLRDAIGHLDRAAGATASELVAEDVRLAARALERLMGRVDREQVLDQVFAAFCIGK